jgi:hypothetical protein
MRALLDALAAAPGRPRPFGEIEDGIGWPRRRIASVLGGVSHLRHTEFGGARPYRFLDARVAPSGRWEMWMDETQARAARAARDDAPRADRPAPSRQGSARRSLNPSWEAVNPRRP